VTWSELPHVAARALTAWGALAIITAAIIDWKARR
jgi:hypothetical protein